MKKFKSKLLICALAMLLPLASLLFAYIQPKEYAYAASPKSMENTATKDFDASSVQWGDFGDEKRKIINLYTTGSDTLNYYTINVSAHDSAFHAERNVEDASIYLKYAANLGGTKKEVKYNVQTKIKLPSYMIGNSKFSYSISTSKCTGTSGYSIQDHNLVVSFGQSYSGSTGSSVAGDGFAVMEINSPQLIISTTDTSAPTIDILSTGATYNNSGVLGRNIQFRVSDNGGSGIQYVKYNGKTEELNNASIADGTTFNFDANYNQAYTIEVGDNVGNVYKYTIPADNQPLKSVSISDFGSVIHNSQVTFSVAHEMKNIELSSNEKIYFKILSLSEYNQLNGNLNLDLTCRSLKTGSNTIDLAEVLWDESTNKTKLTNGTSYKILVQAIDEAGNNSNVYVHEFEYDARQYTITLPNPDNLEEKIVGGRITKVIIGDETFYDYYSDDEDLKTFKTTYSLYSKDRLCIEYEALAGYEFYDLIIDGHYMNYYGNSDYANRYDNLYSNQKTFNFKFRYKTEIGLNIEYVYSYEKDNVYNSVIDSIVINNLAREDLQLDKIWYAVYDSNGNLCKAYNCDNGEIAGEILNVGNYTFSWGIVDEFAKEFVKSSNDIIFQIIPFEINGITYSNYSNLIYTGNTQNISFDLDTSNLSETEKEYLSDQLKFAYYLLTDSAKENRLDSMLDADSYFAELCSLDPNYTVKADEIWEQIVIAKQDINVLLNTNVYKYSESEIELDYSLCDINNLVVAGIVSTPTFEKLEEEIYMSSNFVNAGDYRYTITLDMEYAKNYNLLNPIGVCRIEKVDVYFSVNTHEYDYTGTNISIQFDMLDGENGQKIVSKNNAIYVVVLNDDGIKTDTQIVEVGTYKIAFESDDTNYILHNSETPIVITVNKTVLSIKVETEYEYNGASQVLKYKLYSLDENNEEKEFPKVDGVDVKIYDADNNEITEFAQVGKYTYKFICNSKFDVVSDLIGEINVVPAVVKIEMTQVVCYTENPEEKENLENYDILYSVISTKNTDFANLGFITFNVSKMDESVVWGDVGNYRFTFVSTDPNVKLKTIDGVASSIDIDIAIVAKKVFATIENDYTYSKSDIELNYTIENIDSTNLSDTDISLTILDTENNVMFDAKKYYYTLISTNPNYEIVISNGLVEDAQNYVIVNKKDVSIISATTEFTYNTNANDINAEIDNPFDEDVEFEYEIKTGDKTLSSIVDAGVYSVKVISKNNNYRIIDNTLEVVVNPRVVNAIITSSDFEYNGYNNNIVYSFYDEDNSVDIDSEVYYYLNDEITIDTKNVGLYSYSIVLNNSNYKLLETVGQFQVLPKTLVVKSEQNQYKTYGENDTQIKFTVEGLAGVDSMSDVANIELKRSAGEDVGLYYISYVEGSNTNANYIVSFAENTYVYEIVAKKVLVIANKQTKYFGDTDPDISFKAYLSGVACSENDIPFTGVLSRVGGEDVGSYDIEIGSLEAQNYAITFVKNSFVILQKDLYVTIENIDTVYGTDVELSYSIVGDFDSNSISGQIARVAGNNVGEYTIHKGTLSSANYNLIITNGVYTISKKDLHVSALACSKVYGDIDNFGTLEAPGYTCSGLIDGDSLTGSISRELGENVGVYKFTIGTLNNDNYNIIFESADFEITKANVKIIYESKNQIYGETAQKLTYVVEGLKLNDTKEIFNIHCFREGGNDVGVYTISGSHTQNANYNVEEFVFGSYTIEKARIVPTLVSKKVTYNGKAYSLTADNFDYPLQFVYKCNGFVVDECVNAGTYSVTAEFLGNNNYYPAKSKEATLIIEKQFVFISVTNNEFLFDDTIKYPTFSYDKNIGIDEHSFTFKFENDIFPKEVGSYNYAIIIDDENFEGVTQGTVKIEKAFSATNNMSSILECSDATFDSNIRNVKLVQDTNTKKFNNEKVLSVCSLENIDSLEKKDYVYTVKVKATQGVENVKVYKVGLNGFTEQAIKIEDGYYVFKIDDPNDKYIITTEIKTLSTLAWIVILVSVVLIFGIALIIVAKKKHKKQKVSKVSKKDIETYNVN